VGRRRGRLRLRRELVHVLLAAAAAPEGEELRLEGVVVVVGLAGVAHGREKGILGGQAPLPHGCRRRRLQVLELEDGGRRRVCTLVLHLLVELEQVLMVVVLLLLLICFLLRLRSSSSAAAAASVAAVSTPVVVPRIQIPRLVGRRYWCSGSSNARPSTSPEPITRTARKTEEKIQQQSGEGGGGMGREREREREEREIRGREVVARPGMDTDPGGAEWSHWSGGLN
jgi:hypothetical protein